MSVNLLFHPNSIRSQIIPLKKISSKILLFSSNSVYSEVEKIISPLHVLIISSKDNQMFSPQISLFKLPI